MCTCGATTGSVSISSYSRIQYAVDQLAIFEDASPKHAFTNKSAFLQHAHRREIPFEDRRFEALQVEVLKDMVRSRPDRGSDDTSTPIRLTQPVAKVAGSRVHTLAAFKADAADNFLLDRNSPMRALWNLFK